MGKVGLREERPDSIPYLKVTELEGEMQSRSMKTSSEKVPERLVSLFS